MEYRRPEDGELLERALREFRSGRISLDRLVHDLEAIHLRTEDPQIADSMFSDIVEIEQINGVTIEGDGVLTEAHRRILDTAFERLEKIGVLLTNLGSPTAHSD